MPVPDPVDQFIARWEASGAAERASYALFLTELCDLIDVPRPDPTSPDPAKNRYVFERSVVRKNPDGTASNGFIDLYKAGHFVLETKQGANDPATTDLGDVGHKAKAGHGRRGSAAFVMNWWAQAAELVARGRVKRFGFITTNSIHQTCPPRCRDGRPRSRDRSVPPPYRGLRDRIKGRTNIRYRPSGLP